MVDIGKLAKFITKRIIYLNACKTNLLFKLKTKLRSNTNEAKPAINLAVDSAKAVARPKQENDKKSKASNANASLLAKT